MKSVKLIVTKEKVRGINTLIPSTNFIRDAVNQPAAQSGGFNVEEMQKRIRILNAVEKVEKEFFTFKDGGLDEEEVQGILSIEATLELEDADMKNLNEIMKSARFAIVCQHVIDLIDRISNA